MDPSHRRHRQAYVDWWGLDSWNDHDDGWADRGAERAAVAIAYAVYNPASDSSAHIERHLESFDVLVGRPVPDASALPCAGEHTSDRSA